MVAAALAVVLLTLLSGVLLVVFRLQPAFRSPDELARWAARLNATEVRLTWWGGLTRVVIDPLPLPSVPSEQSEKRDDRPDAERPQSKVDDALVRMARGRAA